MERIEFVLPCNWRPWVWTLSFITHSWIIHTDWGVTVTECTWYGISCNSAGIVTEIDLPSNGLNGTIPSLTALISLETLNLIDNQITGLGGPLPPTVMSLGLSGNPLSITFSQLAAFIQPAAPEILQISVANVMMTGSVTMSMIPFQMPNLKVLEMSSNLLTGELPAFLGTNFTQDIAILDLAYNNFTLPTGAIQSMDFVPSVDISGNPFNTDLLTFFSVLFKGGIASNIACNQCGLSGSFNVNGLRKLIDQLPLVTLRLSSNMISGSYPSFLRSVSNELHLLDLSYNQLTGCIQPVPQDMELLQLMGNPMACNQLPGGVQPTGNGTTAVMYQNNMLACQTLASTVPPLYRLEVDPSYYNYMYCICPMFTYGVNGTCLPCPLNCTCVDFPRQVAVVPTGFFPFPNSSVVVQALACLEVTPGYTPCTGAVTGGSTNGCDAGYKGNLCADCENDYFHIGWACQSCNTLKIGDPYIYVAFMAFLCMFALLSLSMLLTCSLRHRAVLKINLLLFHMQLLGMMRFFRVPLPRVLAAGILVLSEEFPFFLRAWRCVWELSEVHFILLKAFLPVFFIPALIVIVLVVGCFRSCLSVSRRKRLTEGVVPDKPGLVYRKLVYPLGFLIVFFSNFWYFNTVISAMPAWICEEFPARQYFIYMYTSVACDADGVIIIKAGGLVILIAYPIFQLITLSCVSRRAPAVSANLTNLHTPILLPRVTSQYDIADTGSATVPYDPWYPLHAGQRGKDSSRDSVEWGRWWGLVQTLRRFLLALFIVFAPRMGYDATQLVSTVIVIYVVMLSQIRPYDYDCDTLLDMTSNVVIILTVLAIPNGFPSTLSRNELITKHPAVLYVGPVVAFCVNIVWGALFLACCFWSRMRGFTFETGLATPLVDSDEKNPRYSTKQRLDVLRAL
eukprot:TRINITY_DN1494_c0_g1_i1.p1 TRINITY_DN1494_c0_g1~~TRINITY_DN1494_c0_g1_i1.p1  ORF type:complete len:905 (+),score=89.74 TRINITY_DN1494_c0_g1_i1:2351-5065(+)